MNGLVSHAVCLKCTALKSTSAHRGKPPDGCARARVTYHSSRWLSLGGATTHAGVGLGVGTLGGSAQRSAATSDALYVRRAVKERQVMTCTPDTHQLTILYGPRSKHRAYLSARLYTRRQPSSPSSVLSQSTCRPMKRSTSFMLDGFRWLPPQSTVICPSMYSLVVPRCPSYVKASVYLLVKWVGYVHMLHTPVRRGTPQRWSRTRLNAATHHRSISGLGPPLQWEESVRFRAQYSISFPSALARNRIRPFRVLSVCAGVCVGCG